MTEVVVEIDSEIKEDSGLKDESESDLKNEEVSKTTTTIVNPEIQVESDSKSDEPSNTINALDLAAESTTPSTTSTAAVNPTETIITSSSGSNLEALLLSKNTLNHAVSASSVNSCGTDAGGGTSSYEQEITRLREIIRERENALAQMETRLNEVDTNARAHAEHLNQQFSAKLEDSIRLLKESSQRDKNSMVMKYVEGEKKCIELNRSIELLHGKLNDANKERQRMNERLGAAKAEMEKMNAENDKKLKEIMGQKREMERLREQLVLSDAREKAAQMTLAKEIEAHANVQRQLEQASAELGQLKNVEISTEEVRF